MDAPALISPAQFITLTLFLLTLLGLWFVIQRNREGLARKMGQGRRIAVTEVAAISPTDRAMILSVDGRDYLVLRAKGTAPVVTPLPAKAEGGAA